MLSLKHGCEHNVDAPPQHILEQYFGEYSLSAKAHRTHGGSNEFFGNLAHFLLEYGCITANAYSIPKKRAGLIITTYRGGVVDWGILTGEGICATLASFQSGKCFLPVLAQYLAILYPPQTTATPRPTLALPAPPTQDRKPRALQLPQDETLTRTPTSPRAESQNQEAPDNITIWENNKPQPSTSRITSIQPARTPRPMQKTENRKPSMGTDQSLATQQKWDRDKLAAPTVKPAKKRCLQRRSEEGKTADSSTKDRQLVIVPKKTVAIVMNKPRPPPNCGKHRNTAWPH